MIRLLHIFLTTLCFTITLFGNDAIAGNKKPKPDSVQRSMDSVIRKIAVDNKCRLVMKVSHPGERSYYSGFDGRTNQPVKKKMQTVDIGSCSKVFTATSVMQLVESCKFSLQSRLVDILPKDTLYKDLAVIDNGVDYIDSVTIYHLLNHTSGFPDYFIAGDDAKEISVYGDSSLRFKPEELISMAKRINKPKYKPGVQFSYSNTNYILLGLIIEKFSGMSYRNYVQQNIIDQLGLKHTFFSSYNPPKKRSAGHFKGKLSYMPATLAWSAGELISTLDDMEIFISAWYAGSLFKNPATLELIKKDVAWGEQVKTNKYGLGIINMMGQMLGHSGQTFGYQSFMAVTKDNKTITIGVDDAFVSVYAPLLPLKLLKFN